MILVRERAPLRHNAEIITPSGHRYRWAQDESRPENVLNDLAFSSTMPGGDEQLSGTLARKPSLDYADLEELSTIVVRSAGGEIVSGCRLQSSPRTSGDQFQIAPAAVGFQAHLEDQKDIRITYVDRDLSHWGPAALTRRANVTATNGLEDPQIVPDTTGAPGLYTAFKGAWNTPPTSEAWYDAGAGNPIGSIYFAWKKSGGVTTIDANWAWSVIASTDDLGTTVDTSGDLQAAGPGTGTLATTGGNKRFAAVNLAYLAAGANGTDGTDYQIFWTCLAVYGNHGLTKRGTADALNAQGLYASDIVAHAVGTWAPKLVFSTGAGGTIEQSGFVIPHSVFLDPTTVAEIVKQATRFDLQDWAVWYEQQGPTFYCHSRGARGRRWRARSGSAKLQETGPSADRLYNSVTVQYTDVAGATRTVGPSGSGADTTDASLLDTDPQNPANELGITRRGLLAMGTNTPAGAIQVGQRFLAEQKLLDRSGQATHTGHVMDDKGVLWPASYMKAGDYVSYVDAADPSDRRIVKASYTDRDKTCQVDLDAPPQGLQALLERLGVVLVPFGLT